jgi:hypothetical protein
VPKTSRSQPHWEMRPGVRFDRFELCVTRAGARSPASRSTRIRHNSVSDQLRSRRPRESRSLGDQSCQEASGLVREHLPSSQAGPLFLPQGRLRQHRELPAGARGLRALHVRVHHLGQRASGDQPQVLRGCHKSFSYGWREGAGHKFFGPNNATDVSSVKKVNPQSMVHLTEKPVEPAVRAMKYSSCAGEKRPRLFGGSARR